MTDMTEVEILKNKLKSKGSQFSPNINKFTLISMDLVAIYCSWFLYGVNEPSQLAWIWGRHYSIQALVHFFCGAMIVLWLWGNKRHYSYRKPFWDELKDILHIIFFMALTEITILALLKQRHSIEFWGYSWSISTFSIPLFRHLSKKILHKLGYWEIPCVIIANASNAYEVYNAISSEQSMGFKVIAFIDPIGAHSSNHISQIPYITKNDFFERFDKFPKVFIAFENNQSELCDKWLRNLAKSGIRDISVIPTLRGIPLHDTDISHFFSHEIIMLRIKTKLPRKASRFIKRCFDIFISTILLVLLAPFFLYIAYKIKSDGGSAIYGHERIGLNGKKFKCLKFRSMVMNSKEVLDNLLSTDPMAKEEWERNFKLKDDPRITPIGAFLRKTSLDELPQLWNVLIGEMSLVGPRPVVEDELERYADDVDYYLMAKPGISGLWQVSGRSDTDYATRVYLDSWYVKNWSLWSDIVILFKTVGAVLKRNGAY